MQVEVFRMSEKLMISMTSNIIISTLLLLLVKMKLIECHYGEKCEFIPKSLYKQTLHYILGEKIVIKVWCTSTGRGNPEDTWHYERYPELTTRRTNYSFNQHNRDAGKGYNMLFMDVSWSAKDIYTEEVSYVQWHKATTTLTIAPALMKYDNERIISTMVLDTQYYTREIILWVDLDIVQLKKESHPVTVPNTCPNVTLYCEMEYPVVPQRQLTYTWLKVEGDNNIALINSEKYVIGNDGSLIINPLPNEEHGIYECSIRKPYDFTKASSQLTPSRINLTIMGTEIDDEGDAPGCHDKPPIIEHNPPSSSDKPPSSSNKPQTSSDKTQSIGDQPSTTVKHGDTVDIGYLDMTMASVFILGIAAVTIVAILRVTRTPRPVRNTSIHNPGVEDPAKIT